MKRFLKWFFITIIVLVFLAFVFLAGLMLFVSPNRLKPLITEEVKKTTGRTFAIDGDLSWTLYPYLGVKMSHSALGNPDGFSEKSLIEVERVTLGVKLLPLLHGTIESSGVSLSGLKLTLIKNAKGETNWQGFVSTQSSTKGSSFATKRAALGLAISGIDINNASIRWIDETSNKKIMLHDVEIHAKEVYLNRAFPVKIAFSFESSNPSLKGDVSYQANCVLDPAQQRYYLNDLKATVNIQKDNKKWSIESRSNVIANVKDDVIQFNQLEETIENLKMNGKAEVNHFSASPEVHAQFEITPFDLKAFLEAIGQSNPKLSTFKNVSGTLDLTMTAPHNPSAIAGANSTLSGLRAEGQLKVDTIQFNKIKATAIQLQYHLRNGLLDLSPLSASFYQGQLQSETRVDLNPTAPRILSTIALTNVSALALQSDLSEKPSKLKIDGAGNINLQITTQGLSGDEMMSHLNGNGRFSFDRGELLGMDVSYLVDNADAVVHGKVPTVSNTNKTPFGDLKGTVQIQNGVVTNQDLYIDSPRFDTRGGGTIDLVNQHISYTLQVTAKKTSDNQKNNLLNLYGQTLPILVAGSLSDPSIRLDTTAMMKSLAEQQIEKHQDQVKEKLKDQIKKKVKGPAGDLLQNLLGQ